jgi:hypothetical protein
VRLVFFHNEQTWSSAQNSFREQLDSSIFVSGLWCGAESAWIELSRNAALCISVGAKNTSKNLRREE